MYKKYAISQTNVFTLISLTAGCLHVFVFFVKILNLSLGSRIITRDVEKLQFANVKHALVTMINPYSYEMH